MAMAVTRSRTVTLDYKAGGVPTRPKVELVPCLPELDARYGVPTLLRVPRSETRYRRMARKVLPDRRAKGARAMAVQDECPLVSLQEYLVEELLEPRHGVVDPLAAQVEDIA